MTLIFRKFLHGIQLVIRSVQLVIAHPVLLVYSACALGGVLLINTLRVPIMSSTTLYEMLSSLVLLISREGVQLFFFACSAHHAMHILAHEVTGIQETVCAVVQCLPQLAIWLIFLVIAQLITTYPLWTHQGFSLADALLVPLLAMGQTSLALAIERAWSLVEQFFAVCLSIMVLFVGSCFLIAQIGQYSLYSFLGIFILQSLNILTFTIFYFEHYVRPKPELMDIFSPDI